MNSEIQRLKTENARLQKYLDRSNELINRCKNWVGTDLGQDIAQHEAEIKGQRFNALDWDMADRNGEQ